MHTDLSTVVEMKVMENNAVHPLNIPFSDVYYRHTSHFSRMSYCHFKHKLGGAESFNMGSLSVFQCTCTHSTILCCAKWTRCRLSDFIRYYRQVDTRSDLYQSQSSVCYYECKQSRFIRQTINTQFNKLSLGCQKCALYPQHNACVMERW